MVDLEELEVLMIPDLAAMTVSCLSCSPTAATSADVPMVGHALLRLTPIRTPLIARGSNGTVLLLLTRRVDERAVALYREGTIIGGCYTGIGNEATSVGMACSDGRRRRVGADPAGLRVRTWSAAIRAPRGPCVST